MVSASVASLAKVDALAKEAGLGELPFLSPAFIEQRMPFIGAGGLAADRPVGLLFFADPTADLERSLTFVLPVNPGKAELKQFVEQGATPVGGRADLVTMGMVSFRRAKDLFVFGQLPGAVAAVRDDVFTAAYAKDPDAVARVQVDIGAFKRATPERYDAFFAEVGEIAEVKDGARQASADVVTGWMRGLTQLGLSLAPGGEGGLRLSLHAEPFEAANFPPGKIARAGFPEGTIARVDFAVPPARALGGVTEWLRVALARDEQIAKLAPEQQAQVRAFVSGFARFLLEGEAGSFAVGKAEGGGAVAYAVTRRSDPKPDLEAEVKQLVAQGAEAGKALGEAMPSATYESYAAAGGEKVHRLVWSEGGKPTLQVDAVRREGTTFIAVSPAGGKFVERLLPLKPEGETSAPVSGWVDLSALAESGALPDPDATGMDPATVAALKEAVKGQRLDWTAAPQGGGLRVDVNVPKALLQKLPQVVQTLQ